ncbi:MAG: hypothetical protein AAB561_01260 [Patescibacteria group bacterium]
MFKPLGSALERRAQKYEFQKMVQKDAQTLLFAAMTQTIKGLIKPGDIKYDAAKKDITLTTHHRAVANEIALRLDEVYECANKSGVAVSRILITVE